MTTPKELKILHVEIYDIRTSPKKSGTTHHVIYLTDEQITKFHAAFKEFIFWQNYIKNNKQVYRA